MSTLDQADIDVMKASRTCVAGTKFQYDYLNDDINDFGEIDYSLTNKAPAELRQVIEEASMKKIGAKKILILINPPYAEAMNLDNTTVSAGKNADQKRGVASTRIGASMGDLGYAARELFVQFLVRIKREMPNATVAIFSTLKYVNSPNFKEFREQWTAKFLNGMIVHSKAFDGLKGDFPIGFLIWDLSRKKAIKEIRVKALDRNGEIIGEKSFYREESQLPLSEWVDRPKSNKEEAVPLKNAITPTTNTKDVRGDKWANNAIGSMISKGNDFQNAQTATALMSSGYCSAGAFFVTKENLWKASIVFVVRRIIKPSWLNDRDQFLQPTEEPSEEFCSDCLVWMLFNSSNLTAGADGLIWNDRAWSLVNHFVPFAEEEVGANGRFESDFMVRYMKGMKLSAEAAAVMDEGRKLWKLYHSSRFEKKVRDEFKLNRPDVGWYQIRKAFDASADIMTVDFSSFKSAYEALSSKLRPMVYELGFLK